MAPHSYAWHPGEERQGREKSLPLNKPLRRNRPAAHQTCTAQERVGCVERKGRTVLVGSMGHPDRQKSVLMPVSPLLSLSSGLMTCDEALYSPRSYLSFLHPQVYTSFSRRTGGTGDCGIQIYLMTHVRT
jgi:hypothetical protein